MLQRIRNLFVPTGHFRMPSRPTAVSNCTIRPLQDADVDACEALYRLNEPGHFPAGYFPAFSDWLRHRRALILVAEQDGAVRALGGVNAQDNAVRHVACLSFGMVHPEHHGRGFGTLLLLARLTLLETSRDLSFVGLSTAGGSETFYGRFGFSFVRAIQLTPTHLQKLYIVRVSQRDKVRCANALNAMCSTSLPQGLELPPFSE